jgi:hypothetical protein
MSWAVTKEKLALLARTEKASRLFGAEKHQFVSKRVPEYQIKWFEFKHRITLPSEYRTFLLEVGYGAGPHYGIHSLNKGIHWLNEWNEIVEGDYSLHNPFSLTGEDATTLIRQTDPDSLPSLTSLNGMLPICYEGCAYHTYLVVTGEQRGYLWAYCEDDALTSPVGSGRQFSFLEWYSYWLNECLQAIEEKTA